MTDQVSTPLSWRLGFFPTAQPTGPDGIRNCIRDGRNMWILGPALMKSAKGLATSGETGDARLYLVGSALGSITTGSVVPYRGGSYLFIGSGPVRVSGSRIGTASTSLFFNTTLIEANAKPVGLFALTSAPAVEQGATQSPVLNSGSYSVVLTRVRSILGSESNGSLPSQVISVSGKSIRVTFPAVDSSGHDRWGIYVTFRGRGSTGPHFHLGDLDENDIQAGTVSTTFATSASTAGSRKVDLKWNDGQLSSLEPPTDYGTPPPGTHVVTLGNVVVVLGTYEGNGIAAGVSPSIPGKIEAFSASATSFLNPLESVTFQCHRQTDGESLLATKNSLQSLVLTGSASFPVFTRAIWPTTGIQSPNGGCFCESTFYGYSGKAGPVRLGGSEPDTEFALPVYEFLRTEAWDPALVVVGYDRERDAVVYMGNGTSGNLALPFMRSLGVWSPPIELPGVPQAAVTIDGVLKVSIGGAVYNFEQGTGANWYLIPAWQDNPSTMERKTIIGYRSQVNTASATLTIDFLKDFTDTPVTNCTQTSSGSGDRFTKWKRINQRCKVYTLKFSASGAGHRINAAELWSLFEPGVREP